MKKLKTLGKCATVFGVLMLLGVAGSSDFEFIGVYETIRRSAAGLGFIIAGSAAVDISVFAEEAKKAVKRQKKQKKENLKKIKEKIYLT